MGVQLSRRFRLQGKTVTLARFALAALGIATAGCSRDDVICDEKSPGVAYARSLSKDRLMRLYYDMEAYATREETPLNGWWVSRKPGEIPSAFADLA